MTKETVKAASLATAPIIEAMVDELVARAKISLRGGPTEAEPGGPCCKPGGSCCDFVCGN